MSKIFEALAQWTGRQAGRASTFLGAVTLILLWGVSGPMFGFSDTWQLVINTSTTIITFLMVFVMQNTQNRDTRALQLKLDELIRATEGAKDQMISLEDSTEEQLDAVKRRFDTLRDAAPD
ncbi:low affinity iron permease family protein [Neoroseomonas lacus]|uniref:Membrane protein n=1 Tax=Neoroseomonas lacus TaxID=287609 RepID=A0A917NS16_9PROT|nr:low affinity iron permease family protein [Neoroseomonas lacus]GGJ23171.1 membrane protein [Neoroseomonas lacus]